MSIDICAPHVASSLLWWTMTDAPSMRKRKTPRPPLEADLRLLGWGPKGSTTADLDGRNVTIDRGIPGERVTALIDRRRTPWRGVVEGVAESSPLRVSPPCPHYLQRCGGCQWQHMAYEAQLDTKRELVDREMARAGLELRVQHAHVMDHPWRYRRTAAIAIGWEAGFRPRGRRGIVEIRDCPISHPLIGALSSRLNDLLRGGALPNYHGKVWLDCTVAGSVAAPRLQVVIQGIEGLTLEAHPELEEVAAVLACIEGVETVAFRHRSGEVMSLFGPLMGIIDVAGQPLYLPAGAFFQTNLIMLERLLPIMRTHLLRSAVRHAADIYGGVGTFGVTFAPDVGAMTLVELDAQAVTAARASAEMRGIGNMTFMSRHAEHALPEIPALDVAIVDPPRSGLGEVVVKALIDNAVPLILYVSCAPASLARDLAAFGAGGYRVSSLQIFDFYPQTYHVESLAVLER